MDPDHQDHPDLRAHLEVVEVLEVTVDDVEYLVAAVMVHGVTRGGRGGQKIEILG